MFPVINPPHPVIPPTEPARSTRFLAFIILLSGAASFGLTSELVGVLSGRTELEELGPLIVFYSMFLLVGFCGAREHFCGESMVLALIFLGSMQLVQQSMHKNEDGKRLTHEPQTSNADPDPHYRSPLADPRERGLEPQKRREYSSDTPRKTPFGARVAPDRDYGSR